ncbi:hypothetical protein [Paenibacillus beijingensis]|nr:hypothetical protein [Paenibacillus beijingensis]
MSLPGEHAARLSEKYSEEVKRIYADQIYNAASASSNRKKYQRVCGMLKRYKKIAGKASQNEIVLQLENQYNRRPAFLDELAKVQ